MFAMSPAHIAIIIAAILILVLPVQQILHRTGHSRWWTVLMFVPGLNWLAVWILAFVRWPALDKSRS
jgi:hypothetical protein